MRVLHINKSDALGGAAIAANRLHNGLISQGIESCFLVSKAQTSQPHIDEIDTRWLDKRLYRFTHQTGLNDLNFVSTFDISRHSFYQDADVINFHNLHTGYFSYLALPKLTRAKPAVMTLHDMWSFTGHCAYSFECDRWQQGCGQCPDLTLYPPVAKDNTRTALKLKRWTYQRSNLHIVTLSRWLTAQAKQSVLADLPIHYIPNGIDTEVYRPLNATESRASLGIPPDKTALMCAAINLKEGRKGSDLLITALNKLPPEVKRQTVLVVLGNGGDQMAKQVDMKVIPLGFLSDDRQKAMAYSAADLFIFPSKADNLPLVLQESMACGTPMVAFNVGGIPDLVRADITGYLAEPLRADSLCKGITHLLKHEALRRDMAERCRQITLAEYSIQKQVEQYIQLYESIAA